MSRTYKAVQVTKPGKLEVVERAMKTKLIQQPVAQSGIFKIGGDTPVHRLGFGAMRLTGQGIWGEPEDPAECIAVLRRAVDLGINLIDTADSYGPFVSERLIAQALHPYPNGVVIATKAGLQRSGPDQWEPDGRPEYLRERCEGSLRRLKLDRIDLFQLHRIDAKVSLEDQISVLVAMQNEGKIRHIGLSEVSVEPRGLTVAAALCFMGINLVLIWRIVLTVERGEHRRETKEQNPAGIE